MLTSKLCIQSDFFFMTLVCFADAQADSSPAFMQLYNNSAPACRGKRKKEHYFSWRCVIHQQEWLAGHKVAVDTLRHDFCTSERKVFLSKCKVSHSYSLKCKMNINVTDVITAKQDQKSELKASHTLIVCKVIKMDFHQREKRLILWLGVFFSYSLHLSHTERKMAWELQQHFFEIQSSKSSFFFFFFPERRAGQFSSLVIYIWVAQNCSFMQTRN